MKNFLYILFFYLVYCITIACKLQFGNFFPDFWTLLVFLWLVEKSFFECWWILIIAGSLADFASGQPIGGYALGYFLGGIVVWFMDNKVYVFKDNRFYIYFLAILFLVSSYGGFYIFNHALTYVTGGGSLNPHYSTLLVQIAITAVFAKGMLKSSGYAFRFFDKFDRWRS